MKRKLLPALIVSIAAGLAGCQTLEQNPQMARYGGYGALAGAVAGAVAQHDQRAQGALIGAALGGAAAGAYGHHLDQQEIALRSRTLGAGVSITRQDDRIDVILAGAQFFEPGSATLSPLAIQILNEVARSAQQFPGSRIEVTGYSDGTGTPFENAALSQKRANAASMHLQSQGIDISRLALFNVATPSPNNRAAERRLEIGVRPAPQAESPGRSPASTIRPRYRPVQRVAQAQPHVNVHAPYHYNTNPVKSTLGNGVLQGIAGALQNGPKAGVANGVGTIAREASQQATSAARREVNTVIRDTLFEFNR